ncbi:MAG TPA: hypothetical protein VFU59_08140 [Candidatus Eisenbacteria bacterium]|nr:hypothetical protein [Candidatus Eisenbacteria bacterium]
MSQRVAWRLGVRVVVLLVGLAALLAACAKDPVQVDRNRPPRTYLVSAPPESGSFSYRIHLYWRGEDPDGYISGFQWSWDDSSVGAFRFTTKTDSIFELTVNDSATIAGGTSNQPPGTSRGHIFFIRAVDNLGKPDPVLTIFNHRIIISTTQKPIVEFTGSYPSGNGVDSLCNGTPFEVCWSGRDPDGSVIGYKFDVGPYNSPIIADSCATFNDPNDPNSIALASGVYTLTIQAIDNAYALSDPGGSKFFFVVNRDPSSWFLREDGTRPATNDEAVGYYIQPYYKGQPIAPVSVPFHPGDTVPFRSTVWWKWDGEDNACDNPNGLNAFSLALSQGARNDGDPYIIGFLSELAPGVPFKTNDPNVLGPLGLSNLILDQLDAGNGMKMLVRSRDVANRVSGLPYSGEFIFNCNFKPKVTGFTVTDCCSLNQKYKIFSWVAEDNEDGFPKQATLSLENGLERRVVNDSSWVAIPERVFRTFSETNPHVAEVRVRDAGGFESDEILRVEFNVDYADSTCTGNCPRP